MRRPATAAFSSPLMRPAREAMAELLAAAELRDPPEPAVSNVDALPLPAGEAARDARGRQIDSPVRWVESVEWMAARAGVELFLEIGAGGVLSALNRRIAPAAGYARLASPPPLT